ncbi:class I SAM-dependent methyltransferase [Agromyces atrinae]|uniref:class I SAM-dependent methyltransferase n=1 Tax=Agromyces atrinae TaxID=592376 RepID=UPI001F5A82BC|nr:class I SAM-dependent methyltransferase [Agromyces atrinae]MCI2959182.1 class I SAM-dependent methyltransferase [Agromyces atrinae]
MASVELSGGEWLDANRANWDERVPVHLAATDFYDQEPLRRGGSVLDPLVTRELAERFPDGLAGLRILHLQCHFGADSLSLVHAGATVVGLDFSRPAVTEARRLAAEFDVAGRARFIEGNIYDARHLLPEPESFDVVFTTWGTIGWLPDVAEWARIVAWYLKPGGVFYFADGHPSSYVFDGDAGPAGLPVFAYPYGNTEPDVVDDPSDYADADAALANSRTFEWMHPVGEIFGAITAAGLRIERLDEHYEVPWRIFPATEPQANGMWGWPAEKWLPLSLSLTATAPES